MFSSSLVLAILAQFQIFFVGVRSKLCGKVRGRREVLPYPFGNSGPYPFQLMPPWQG